MGQFERRSRVELTEAYKIIAGKEAVSGKGSLIRT